ncbi:hypothetical protein, partial [Staphylococcus aureus]
SSDLIAPILRGRLATESGNPDVPWKRMILEHRASAEILALLADPACGKLAMRGPLTPDHVIRTKAHALFLPDLALDDADKLALQVDGEIRD